MSLFDIIFTVLRGYQKPNNTVKIGIVRFQILQQGQDGAIRAFIGIFHDNQNHGDHLRLTKRFENHGSNFTIRNVRIAESRGIDSTCVIFSNQETCCTFICDWSVLVSSFLVGIAQVIVKSGFTDSRVAKYHNCIHWFVHH